MMGGIDQLVKQRMNIGRQNPQALQQPSSPMDPKLIELLALQKLKTEKEQAMQQLQLGQQTPPQTIAQQREQQVSDLTKKEVAAGIGGALQQKEKQRQQQLMQMMGGAGIASVPRPPVNRMPPQGFANGGLVSFAGGGCVKGYAEGGPVRTISDQVITALKQYGPAKAREMFAGNTAALAILNEFVTGNKSIDLPATGAFPNTRKAMADQGGVIRQRGEEYGPLGRAGAGIMSLPSVAMGFGRDVLDSGKAIGMAGERLLENGLPGMAGMVNNTAQAAPPAAPTPGAESLQEVTPAPRRSSVAAPGGPMSADPMTSGIMSPFDPDKAGTELEARREQGYKKWMEPSQTDLQDMRAQRANIEAINTKQNDPRRLEMDRFKNFWLGMGNQSSNAGALRGAGIASTLTKDRQDQQARLNAEKSYNMSGDIQTRSGEYGKGGFEAGVAGYDRGAENALTRETNAINAADVKQRGVDSNLYRLNSQLTATKTAAAELSATLREGAAEMMMTDPEMQALKKELDDVMDPMWGEPDAAKVAELQAKMDRLIRERFAEELRLLEAYKVDEEAISRQLGRRVATGEPTGVGSGLSTEGMTYLGEVK
jgi:hypothetical protein